MTRLLVGCTAIIAALMGDIENSLEYSLLTGQSKENRSYPIWIFLMISLIVLIITDYRIDKFRKSVDSQHQFNEEQTAEEEIHCIYYCRKYSLRVVSGILFTFISCIILFIVIFAFQENLDLKRLRKISINYIIMENIIPFVLIVRNQKLFCFFKQNLLSKPPLFSVECFNIKKISLKKLKHNNFIRNLVIIMVFNFVLSILMTNFNFQM